MNSKKQYAFYGSLRPNHYNFREGLKVIEDNITLEGYQLFSLGAFPAAVKTGDPNDKLIVTLTEIPATNVERSIDAMEIGAGYKYEEVEVKGENYGIYVYEKVHDFMKDRKVESGNWSTHSKR